MAFSSVHALGTLQGSLPAHQADDVLIHVLDFKPSNVTPPAITSGPWVLLGGGAGGTGGTNVNDGGQTGMAVYMVVATSSSMAQPVYSTAGMNVALGHYQVWRPDSGKVFRDVVVASPGFYRQASDTTVAGNVLTATMASAFTDAPETDDAIAIFGSFPTDSIGFTSATASATGLSGGTVTGGATGTSIGPDLGLAWGGWTGFTGTATGAVTPAFNLSSAADTGGLVVAVALRQTASGVTSGSGSLSLSGSATAAGEAPASASGSLSFSATASGEVSATASGTIDLSGSGAATGESSPASATGSLSLSGTGSGGGASSATGSLELTGAGDASAAISTDRGQEGARFRGGYGTVFWTPPVIPLPIDPGGLVVPGGPIERSGVTAHAFGAITLNTHFQPVFTVSSATAPGSRQQIVINGVDVSYFRNVVTPPVSYTLLEPLLYGPGSMTFPQISACFEREGVGALSWLKAGANVQVNRVVDGVVVGTDWKGFIAAFDKSGASLVVELGGEANGRAALRDRQVPIFPRFNDLGRQMADVIWDLRLPHHPKLGPVTGIEQMTTGGTGHLDHINDLHAKAWTRAGGHWVTMPNEDTGVYETNLKDTTTIHATAFLDDARTVGNLRRDIAEEPNQIFVTCVTRAGKRVRFGAYPGLVQGPPPPFPGHLELGDTGEGVRLLIGKLQASGYLRLVDVGGGYDDDVFTAVIDLQDDAGLAQTGEVNLATWEALYDVNVTGFSLEWASVQPAAQRSKTRKYDRSANGTIVGFNDDYDPDVIVRHRSIDLGAGVSRKQAREYALTTLHDSNDPNWVGDITFNTGALVRGNKAIGATLTGADVMYAEELRPGMNLSLPQFDGGTLVHISACQVTESGVTATVDTRFRDAMEVWEVIARNRESRNDPARKRNRKARASTIAKDSIGEWDEFAGMLGVDLNLISGWNVFPVIAAMAGTVHRIRIKLNNDAEFACAVFGEKINAATLNNLIPLPLTISGTKDWERPAIVDVLEEHFINYAAGTVDEPCGYSPGKKSDGDDLTGLHKDSGGFSYFAENRTTVWVAVWVEDANVIATQRVLEPQLEASV